ncbi:MAG: type II toxin-antitoxin system RelE/ParE family toxin [Deltaproteobacteria bacterium]|nr:type II toxin-antitoxin system RelE/ParE family toxin [Deltaproteobacteria bacterium]
MDVIWQTKAIKQLKKIGDCSIQERIMTASRSLSEFPVCSNVKRLTDYKPTFRLRVCNWRVFFNVFEEIGIISIEEVKKRDENTY